MRLGPIVSLALLLAACHSHAARPLPERAAPRITSGLPMALPEALGFDSAGLAAAVAFVRAEEDSGAYPGAVLAVGRHGRLALLAPVGQYGVGEAQPVERTTVYDLASLTKVVGLTTACMLLVDEEKLSLDAPVQRYVPEFRGPGKERVTIRHLLTHSSGLPDWRPLYRESATRAEALALVDTTPLAWSPGERFMYSDLGAIVLAQVVEAITGQPLDQFLATRVFGPLGMSATRFLPPPTWWRTIAPTALDTTFRHRMLRGEVHDANAGRLEGVSGHAGLFSNAADLSRFAAMLLNGGAWDSVQLIHAETLAEFTHRQDLPPGSSRALGWDTPDEPRTGSSSAGVRLSQRSFGHTGFTGTSMWMDPERDLFVILLTNRVNQPDGNNKIRRVRSRVADLVVEALAHPEL